MQIEDSASRQAAEHLSKISRLQVRIQRYVQVHRIGIFCLFSNRILNICLFVYRIEDMVRRLTQYAWK